MRKSPGHFEGYQSFVYLFYKVFTACLQNKRYSLSSVQLAFMWAELVDENVGRLELEREEKPRYFLWPLPALGEILTLMVIWFLLSTASRLPLQPHCCDFGSIKTLFPLMSMFTQLSQIWNFVILSLTWVPRILEMLWLISGFSIMLAKLAVQLSWHLHI